MISDRVTPKRTTPAQCRAWDVTSQWKRDGDGAGIELRLVRRGAGSPMGGPTALLGSSQDDIILDRALKECAL